MKHKVLMALFAMGCALPAHAVGVVPTEFDVDPSISGARVIIYSNQFYDQNSHQVNITDQETDSPKAQVSKFADVDLVGTGANIDTQYNPNAFLIAHGKSDTDLGMDVKLIDLYSGKKYFSKVASVSTEATIESNVNIAYTHSDASIKYFLRIVGNTPTVLVDFSGVAKSTDNNDVFGGLIFSNSTNAISVLDGNGTIMNSLCFNSTQSGTGCGVLQGTNFFNFSATLRTGSIYSVNLFSSSSADTCYAPPWPAQNQCSTARHTASGYIDPYISISDSNVDAAAYQIYLSKDVGNYLEPSSEVPEPSSWALMLAGFTVVGVTARRRRSAVASPTRTRVA